MPDYTQRPSARYGPMANCIECNHCGAEGYLMAPGYAKDSDPLDLTHESDCPLREAKERDA